MQVVVVFKTFFSFLFLKVLTGLKVKIGLKKLFFQTQHRRRCPSVVQISFGSSSRLISRAYVEKMHGLRSLRRWRRRGDTLEKAMQHIATPLVAPLLL